LRRLRSRMTLRISSSPTSFPNLGSRARVARDRCRLLPWAVDGHPHAVLPPARRGRALDKHGPGPGSRARRGVRRGQARVSRDQVSVRALRSQAWDARDRVRGKRGRQGLQRVLVLLPRKVRLGSVALVECAAHGPAVLSRTTTPMTWQRSFLARARSGHEGMLVARQPAGRRQLRGAPHPRGAPQLRTVLAVRAALRHSQAARAISAHTRTAHARTAHTAAARDVLVPVPPAKHLRSDSHRWSARPLSSALLHSSESRRWSRHMHALVAISQKPPPWHVPRGATTRQLRTS
jgi:hypothetical protein